MESEQYYSLTTAVGTYTIKLEPNIAVKELRSLILNSDWIILNRLNTEIQTIEPLTIRSNEVKMLQKVDINNLGQGTRNYSITFE